MPVAFKPKAGKPHIRLITVNKTTWTLTPVSVSLGRSFNIKDHLMHADAFNYCCRVSPHYYRSPGEAARALHGIKL